MHIYKEGQQKNGDLYLMFKEEKFYSWISTAQTSRKIPRLVGRKSITYRVY